MLTKLVQSRLIQSLVFSIVVLIPAIAAVLPAPASAQVVGPIDTVAPPAEVVAVDRYRDRVRSGEVTVVSEFNVSMTSGEVLEIETVNVSEGGIPVLHILNAQNGQELAVNIGGGAAGAKVTYQSDAERTVIVVVRSRVQEAAGSADLLKNGEAWKTGVTFAGWHQHYEDLIAGERLQTIHQPGGTASLHRIYIIDRNNLSIHMRATGGGPNGAAIADLAYEYNKTDIIIAVPRNDARERILLLRNDILNDSDGDGLGNGLEASLGTCSALSGWVSVDGGYEFDCSLAADPRDTDGDGISDGLEVFGKVVRDDVVVADSQGSELAVVLPDVAISFQTNVNLPLWGADPRHKDLFIEADFMMRYPDEAPGKIGPEVARQFAAYYSDTVDNPIPLIDLYRAVSLKNPDGRRGISTHIDTGNAPETAEDATIFGDWGGYNAVAPVQNADGVWGGDNPQTAWQNNMHPARRGIFRYIMVYPSGGGQNPVSSFAGSGPLNNAWVLAHEFAHAMGLTHSGPPGATGPVDPNCKPNYQSLLNYGFQSNPEVGFSDGIGAPSLNNAALREWEAVDPSNTAYLDVLENTFKYYVDRSGGHVDWNRDGEFAPAGTTVRAYANYKPGGGGCEFTRYNQSMIENAASVQSPAMARLGNRLYVFSSTLGAVFYTYSTDAGNCPQASLDACATWNGRGIAYMDAQGGIDIVKIGDGANAALLVVTIDNNGKIWERRLSVDSNGREQWTDHRQIAGSASENEPALSDLGYCKVMLAYRGADGNVRYNRLTCSDNFANWQGEQTALDQDGNPIAMADFTSPGIGRAYLGEPGLASIYGAFADVSGYLDLYRYNETTTRWEKTSLLEGRPGPVEGRPALQWTSEFSEIDYPGKFYLMYISHDTNESRSYREKQRTVQMLTSYVKVDRQADGSLTKTLKVGLKGPFDNVWLYAFGIDLFFEAGVDSNLRAVQSIAINKAEIWAGIQFRPKADGIHDFTMTDYNDWEVLRIGLCKNVVNPGGTVSNPIACPTG